MSRKGIVSAPLSSTRDLLLYGGTPAQHRSGVSPRAPTPTSRTSLVPVGPSLALPAPSHALKPLLAPDRTPKLAFLRCSGPVAALSSLAMLSLKARTRSGGALVFELLLLLKKFMGRAGRLESGDARLQRRETERETETAARLSDTETSARGGRLRRCSLSPSQEGRGLEQRRTHARARSFLSDAARRFRLSRCAAHGAEGDLPPRDRRTRRARRDSARVAAREQEGTGTVRGRGHRGHEGRAQGGGEPGTTSERA